MYDKTMLKLTILPSIILITFIMAGLKVRESGADEEIESNNITYEETLIENELEIGELKQEREYQIYKGKVKQSNNNGLINVEIAYPNIQILSFFSNQTLNIQLQEKINEYMFQNIITEKAWNWIGENCNYQTDYDIKRSDHSILSILNTGCYETENSNVLIRNTVNIDIETGDVLLLKDFLSGDLFQKLYDMDWLNAERYEIIEKSQEEISIEEIASRIKEQYTPVEEHDCLDDFYITGDERIGLILWLDDEKQDFVIIEIDRY